jgi:hypothetical protein
MNNIATIGGTKRYQGGKTIELVVSPYKRKCSNYKTNTWTITDSYLLYKKELGANALDKKTYIKLMKEVAKEMSIEIIRNVYHISLPHRLGKLGIKKRKNNRIFNKQRLDYGKYNKSKVKLYHVNTHTQKYYFFWDWETYDNAANFTNQKCYKFTPTRGNDGETGTRGLAAWIKHCADTPTIKDYDRLTKR